MQSRTLFRLFKTINFKCVADSSIRMRGHVLYIRSVEFCSRDAARLLSPSVHDPTLLRLLLSTSTTQPVPTAARLAGTFTTAPLCKLAGPRPTGTQTQLAVFLAVPTRHSAENLLCEKMDKSWWIFYLYLFQTMADLGESIRVYKEECLEDDVASVRRELETPASSSSSFQNLNTSKEDQPLDLSCSKSK